MCYHCCTARDAASSCLFHFNQLPPNQQHIVLTREQAAAAPPIVPPVIPPVIATIVAVGLPPSSSSPSIVPAPHDDNAASVIQLHQPVGAAPQSEPWRDAFNLLASQMAAMAAQVATMASQLASAPPRAASAASSASISNVAMPIPAPIPQLSSSSRPLISSIPLPSAVPSAASPSSNANAISFPGSSPHRQAVLGASPTESAAIEEMINRVMRTATDDNGNNQHDDVKEVRHTTQTPIIPGLLSSPPPPPLLQPLTHTRSTIFPSTLAPPPIGGIFTEQLVSANGIKLTSANFFDAKKFKSVEDLRRAFTDWETLAYRSCWSAHHIRCISRYRSLVVDSIAAGSLAVALSYHLLFARAVDAQEHNMFGPDGSEYHMRSFMQASPLLSTSTKKAWNANNGRGSRKNNSSSNNNKDDDKVFAAGSCTYHPKSVTHDTSMCSKNKTKATEPKSDK